jgi:non-homologous end joining protein Ku
MSLDPSHHSGHYDDTVVELLKQKQTGPPAEPAKDALVPNRGINLMNALRKHQP